MSKKLLSPHNVACLFESNPTDYSVSWLGHVSFQLRVGGMSEVSNALPVRSLNHLSSRQRQWFNWICYLLEPYSRLEIEHRFSHITPDTAMTWNSILHPHKQKTVKEWFANSPRIKPGSSRIHSAREVYQMLWSCLKSSDPTNNM